MNVEIINVIEEALVEQGFPAGKAREQVREFTRVNSWIKSGDLENCADVTELAHRYDCLDAWLSERGCSIAAVLARLQGSEKDVVDVDEFESARDMVLEFLRSHGNHDPFGHGDYYLVEDRARLRQLLLEVQNPQKITEAVVAKLSNFLIENLPGWELIVRYPKNNDVLLPLSNENQRG